MKSWLQSLHEHFIPSEKNAYQPHFLRLRVAAGLLVLVLVFEALYLLVSYVVLPQSGYLAAVLSSVLVEQTNEVRTTEKLHGLLVNEKLVKAAQMKADDMVAKGYFAHNAPDGTTPWHWFEEAGYAYAAAGENLAVNFTESKDVTAAWMRSPAHRANIMNGTYTEIGIATARGTYKGKDAIFVVQEFGRPALVAREVPSESSLPSPVNTETPVLGAATPPAPIVTPTAVSLSSSSEMKVSRSTSSLIRASNTPLSLVSASGTVVAGAETERLPLEISSSTTSASVPVKVSPVAVLATSPRSIATTIFFALLGVVFLALALTVFIKFRVQFPHLIINGILLIGIILSLICFNAVLSSWWGAV